MEFQSPYETDYSRKERDEYSTDVDDYECKMCGFFYDTMDVEVPENASIYWVASCPYCGAKMTSNPVNENRMEIGLDMLRHGTIDEDNREYWLNKLQAQARHLHGREVHEYGEEEE